ncbi:MAG TPA: 2'-5' RNA ligase family protein [Acetobacteraceae bacterium]
MPYAVTLRLDDASAARIQALTETLADRGFAGGPSVYPPHVTLGLYGDEADAEALAASVATLGASWRPLRVHLAAIGIFPGSPCTLWLLPVTTSALLVRHAQLVGRHTAHPHYASGAWVPHVTLLQRLAGPEEAGAALAASAALWQPHAALLDRVELVRFHPVEIVASCSLG